MDPAEYDGLYNINFGGTVNVLSFVIGVRKPVSLQWCPRGFVVVLCLLQIWVLVPFFLSDVTDKNNLWISISKETRVLSWKSAVVSCSHGRLYVGVEAHWWAWDKLLLLLFLFWTYMQGLYYSVELIFMENKVSILYFFYRTIWTLPAPAVISVSL